ncbi:MAG: rhomboid family intramembrane serine protease [Halobacteriaceae archaeon]
MARCDECGQDESMPYQCRLCGGTYCAEHRLPENHSCPGLDSWGDPDGVFDSGFDDSINTEDGQSKSGRLRETLRPEIGTRPGGLGAYFRGNMTYGFLAAMWLTFLFQFVVFPIVLGIGVSSPTWDAVFVLSPEHPAYVWTYLTSIFAHGSIVHIAVNSIVIYFFGRLVEQYIGSVRFAALFLFSGVLAGGGQILVQLFQGITSGGVVGASGAGLAILGVMTVLNPGLRVYLYFILPVPLWLLTIGYTALTVFSIYQGGAGAGGIAQVAHLIGLIGGLLYGEYIKDEVRAPNQLRFGPGGPGGPGGRRRGPF